MSTSITSLSMSFISETHFSLKNNNNPAPTPNYEDVDDDLEFWIFRLDNRPFKHARIEPKIMSTNIDAPFVDKSVILEMLAKEPPVGNHGPIAMLEMDSRVYMASTPKSATYSGISSLLSYEKRHKKHHTKKHDSC